ncbi:hypothetical protein ABC382_01070 [Lysinibacillus sp. 1P01SD]|uniref:hypothetical protein n=1 Tax=Lysinibacillus sp. 1P01SD TaxID=3132285 RepID=UPI00399F0C53
MKNLCPQCDNEKGYLSNVYKDKETKEIKAICSSCNAVFNTTFEPNTQQNFDKKIDEEQEQEQIKALLEGCTYRFPPDSSETDVILAFRMLLEDGNEPTNKEEFYSLYECVISNSVHEFQTDDLQELLDRPDELYWDYGEGGDCEPVEWHDIDFDLRYFYLIDGTFYYFVG